MPLAAVGRFIVDEQHFGLAAADALNRFPEALESAIEAGYAREIVTGVNVTDATYQKGQTGLPEAVLKTVDSVDDSYAEWVKDLFGTLTMMVPLLEPETVFVHGQPAGRRDFLIDIVEKNVPQFASIMKSCGSELVIMDDNAFGIAKGAAFMCIQKLYEVQMLEGKPSYSVLKWDELFELHDKSQNKSLLKI